MAFIDVQQSFINYIRDPNSPLPKGTDERHMAVYRELFFNNIDGLVSNAFPVLKSLYSDNNWQTLVNTFYLSHDCKTPIFSGVSKEFLTFLQMGYQGKPTDPIFILELAHYEWIELDVAIQMDNSNQHVISDENIDGNSLCLSDLARIVQYSFDVQNISVDYQPIKALDTPVFFCVYRDLADEVQFLKLNPLAAQLLQFLFEKRSANWSEIISWLKTHFTQIESSALESGARQLILQMVKKGVVRRFL